MQRKSDMVVSSKSSFLICGEKEFLYPSSFGWLLSKNQFKSTDVLLPCNRDWFTDGIHTVKCFRLTVPQCRLSHVTI